MLRLALPWLAAGLLTLLMAVRAGGFYSTQCAPTETAAAPSNAVIDAALAGRTPTVAPPNG